MKSLKNLFAGLTVAVALAASGSAQAAFIASDDFTYDNGQLLGENGGAGWGGAWGSAAPGDALIDGNALELSGNNANIVYRTLGSSVSSSSVYVSFLFTPLTNVSSITNAFMGFWFDNAASGSHTNVPNFGLKTTSSNDLFARVVLGDEEYASGSAVTANTTYQLVFRMSKVGGSSNYNEVELWVNPVNESSTSVVGSAGGSLGSFGVVGIRTTNLGSSELLIDDLRIGTTFADVTSVVPEPTSLALLGMAGLAGLGRVIRRRK